MDLQYICTYTQDCNQCSFEHFLAIWQLKLSTKLSFFPALCLQWQIYSVEIYCDMQVQRPLTNARYITRPFWLFKEVAALQKQRPWKTHACMSLLCRKSDHGQTRAKHVLSGFSKRSLLCRNSDHGNACVHVAALQKERPLTNTYKTRPFWLFKEVAALQKQRPWKTHACMSLLCRKSDHWQTRIKHVPSIAFQRGRYFADTATMENACMHVAALQKERPFTNTCKSRSLWLFKQVAALQKQRPLCTHAAMVALSITTASESRPQSLGTARLPHFAHMQSIALSITTASASRSQSQGTARIPHFKAHMQSVALSITCNDSEPTSQFLPTARIPDL